MPDNEPIPWSTLTPNQRNALVAEHVFGRKVVKWAEDRDLLLEREGKPGQHESVPAYTENMDAVWKVLQKMAIDESIDLVLSNGLLLAQMEEWEVLQWVASWTPELICLAALRALKVPFAKKIEGKQ